MSVFQKKYRDRNGKERVAAKWTVQFNCHRGIRRQLTVSCTSARAAGRIEDKVRACVDARMTDVGLTPELRQWICSIPQDVTASLMRWDIIPATVQLSRAPLDTLVKRWVDGLRAEGKTPNHCKLLEARVLTAFCVAGCKSFADIDGADVLMAIMDMDLSTQTRRHYWVHCNSFVRWYIRTTGSERNPLASARPKWVVESDRRRVRRALSAEELVRLIQTTDKSQRVYERLTGEARAAIYWIASETGLRANEIRSLRADQFRLDSLPCRIHLGAGSSKRRKADVVQIRAALADYIRDLLPSLDPKQVFRVPGHCARMIRADLEDAGIDAGDPKAGVVDFHALRHTFVTQIASGGASLFTARELARHSSVTTTQRYVHTNSMDTQKAIAGLPAVSVGL
jgi:integrase